MIFYHKQQHHMYWGPVWVFYRAKFVAGDPPVVFRHTLATMGVGY